MQPYFPLFVNLNHKKIVVYGAGRIAIRRIRGILRFGAEVTVIAPQVRKELWELYQNYEKQLSIEQRAYQYGEIQKQGVYLVLAATDDRQVNQMISTECSQKDVMVNNASDSSQCDFYFPALVEREGLVMGVTSIDGNHKKVAEFCGRLRGKEL